MRIKSIRIGTGLDIQVRTRLMSNSEWYVRYACAARRRARCECTFQAGEIVAVKLALTRPVWMYPNSNSHVRANLITASQMKASWWATSAPTDFQTA